MRASIVRSLPARLRFALIALVAVCLAAISPTYAQPPQAEPDFAAVDAYVEAQRQALHIPGLALAIVRGDQVAYMHGYGQADPDGRAVTAQTPFMIGSVTKSFTALAIMQLVEAGQLALDAPVQTYLPWFRVADPHASAQITVRHLLNQTSGLSTASGVQEEMASDLSDTAIEAAVRRLADDPLAHAPGTVYEYSNVNYNILGLIVQTVAGQSYESYIQEHIFDPLEMRQSFTSLDGTAAAGMASGDNPNFTAHVLMLPTEKLGVVVLLNAQGLSMSDGPGQIARGVLAVVTGKQPRPYRFPVEGLLTPLVGSVLVPVALALVWIGWTLFRFLRRQKQGLPARRSAGWYGRAVGLPLIVDLGLLWVLLMGIPWVWGGVPLNVMAAYFAELHTLLMGSAVALGVWGLARTLLTLRPAKSPPPAIAQPQAAP